MVLTIFLERDQVLVASNAIQTIDNEVSHRIIHRLNCIRRMKRALVHQG